jgi:hypothetical protein
MVMTAQTDSGVRQVAVRTQIPASILRTGNVIVVSNLRKELINMLASILGAQLSWHFADGWVFEPAAVGPDADLGASAIVIVLTRHLPPALG